jgi:hypothetical protein
MWIRAQNGEEILEVKRFRSVVKGNGDANILAKLDRETVVIGTYSKDQVESLMYHLSWLVEKGDNYYAMPVRWEEEE